MILRKQFWFTILIIALAVCLLFGMQYVDRQMKTPYKAGTYYACAKGYAKGMWVKMEVSQNAILSLEVLEHNETEGLCEIAIEQFPYVIIDANDLEVDVIAGATKTCRGIKRACEDCLLQARGKKDIVEYVNPNEEIPEEPVEDDNQTTEGNE